MNFYDCVQKDLSGIRGFFELFCDSESSFNSQRSHEEKSLIKEQHTCISPIFKEWREIKDSDICEPVKNLLLGNFLVENEQKIADFAKCHFQSQRDSSCQKQLTDRLFEVQKGIYRFLAESITKHQLDGVENESEASEEFYVEGMKFKEMAAGETTESACLQDCVRAFLYFKKAKTTEHPDREDQLNSIKKTLQGLLKKPQHFLLGKLIHAGALSVDHPLFLEVYEFVTSLSIFRGDVQEKINHLLTYLKLFEPHSVQASLFLNALKATIKRDHFIKDPLSETEEDQTDYQKEILEKREAQIKRNFTPSCLKPLDQVPQEKIAFVREIFKKDSVVQLYKSPFRQCLAENDGTLELNIALAMSKVKEKLIERFVHSKNKGNDEQQNQDILYLKHKFSKKWSLNLDVDIESCDKSQLITPTWSNISFTNFFLDVLENGAHFLRMNFYSHYTFTEVALNYFLEIVNAEPLAQIIFEKIKERLENTSMPALLKEYYEKENPPQMNLNGATAILFSLGYMSNE